MNSIKSHNDPIQIEELECTRRWLKFWESQVNSMAWNTENEDGSMVRLVDKPHNITSAFINAENKAISNITHFPAGKRELLDVLQVRLVAYEDRVEVNSIFSKEIISRLLCTST